MKVSKWIIIAIGVLIVAAIGGFIYEKITSGRTIDLLNASVADYVRANNELRGQLQSTITEVEQLIVKVERADGQNRQLRERLETSEKLVADIIEAGQETTAGIDSGLEGAAGIRADNLYIARQIRESFKLIERIRRDSKQQ